MCLSCGYGEPEDDHGSPDHGTWTDPRKTSRVADVDPARVADTIRPGMEALGTPPS
ncbi:hypothetical protein [Microbispora bryophytorum]|uniref:Uncharacterized protein n=1 Tax=Microbispora bryophytorum TaxID=1460882 RepID=A0A8H9H6Z4_9ACTN|nr:hypothetical protein [Microbispora bryophytorum]MBD3137701.1 hypothetical protein [Microbispora bryophytorum]GGO20495.1 hypothetical protein GCM10011574_46970 [Microbispora bryophytorum]